MTIQRLLSAAAGPSALAIFAAVTVAACSATPATEHDGTSSEAIIDGTPVTSDTLGSAMLWYCPNGTSGCVFQSGSAAWGCSGTMIADKWFLTAHHCVTAGGEALTGGTAVAANDILVWSADHTTSATGVQIFRHPTLDVALVELSGSIESANHAYCTPIYTGASVSLENKTVYCQGFGINSVPSDTGFGTLRSAEMTVAGASVGNMYFFPNATGQSLAPGDSGSGCFLGPPGTSSNAVVATMSYEDTVAPNFPPSDDELVGADGFQSWATSTVAQTTCAASGWECGAITDGCGETVSCGTCSGATPFCYGGECYRCAPRTCPVTEHWDPTTCACVGCPCGLIHVDGHYLCAICKPEVP